jgi:hypothetical protein
MSNWYLLSEVIVDVDNIPLEEVVSLRVVALDALRYIDHIEST